MRLQKFLAQAGVSSRRKAEALIASGAVRVNGVAVTELGTSVNASNNSSAVPNPPGKTTTAWLERRNINLRVKK